MQTLTNEELKKLFKSNFILANHAIRLARHYVHSGHEVTVDSLLQEVRRHPQVSYIETLEKLENSEEE